MSGRTRPAGWLLDKSVAARLVDPAIAVEVARITEPIGLCPMGKLEQFFSSTSAADYDPRVERVRATYVTVDPPRDVFEQVLALQHDLAHHHGMWHRTSIPDLFIAVTALANDFGVLHHDGDFERVAKVRPLIQRRIG